MLNLIKAFFSLQRKTPEQSDLERFLAQSVDIYDLEQRQRRWDRGARV